MGGEGRGGGGGRSAQRIARFYSGVTMPDGSYLSARSLQAFWSRRCLEDRQLMEAAAGSSLPGRCTRPASHGPPCAQSSVLPGTASHLGSAGSAAEDPAAFVARARLGVVHSSGASLCAVSACCRTAGGLAASSVASCSSIAAQRGSSNRECVWGRLVSREGVWSWFSSPP